MQAQRDEKRPVCEPAEVSVPLRLIRGLTGLTSREFATRMTALGDRNFSGELVRKVETGARRASGEFLQAATAVLAEFERRQGQ